MAARARAGAVRAGVPRQRGRRRGPARLTAEDLKELGVAAVGHRRKLLDAIAALRWSARTRQAGPRSPSQAERRQLTVMFVDLVGSTALSARLDPEEMRELLRAYQRAVAAEVERQGGRVAKYLGDGVLAYFGFPRAHEDDAERAVRAGLAAVAATAGCLPPRGGPWRRGSGIATGVVVVGDLIGEGAAREEAVVGETPNLAARLQALAEPGGGRDRRAHAPARRRPVRVRRPRRGRGQGLRRAGARLPRAARRRRREPLRGPARRGPRRRWSGARRSWSCCCAAGGRPRAARAGWCCSRASRASASRGCSRRSQERLARRAARPPALLLLAAPPGQRAPPGHRASSSARPGSRATTRPRPGSRSWRRCWRGPRTPPRTWRCWPSCCRSRPATATRRCRSTPQRKRERTFAALLRQLERSGAPAGRCWWCSRTCTGSTPARASCSTSWSSARPGLPVLLLVTYRPEFQPPWTGQPHVTTLALSRLGPARGRRAGAAASRAARPCRTSWSSRDRRAHGRRAAVRRGADQGGARGRRERRGRTLAAASPAALAVPATLHASLMARLDRLGAAAKEVAQVGAVIGREFSHELLAAVAGLRRGRARGRARPARGGRAGLPARRAARRPATCSSTRWCATRPTARSCATGGGSSTPPDRARPGGAVARAGRDGAGADRAPPDRGRRGRSGRCGYWLKAGRRSAERSAEREAVRQLRRGLEALASLPPSAERDRLGARLPARPRPAAGLHLRLREPGRRGRLRAGEGALREPRRRRPADPGAYGLFAHHVVRGECRAALGLAERLRAAAERGGDPVERLLGHRTLGTALMQLGLLAGGPVGARGGRGAPRSAPRPALAARYIIDPHASGLGYLALVLWMLGYPDQARGAAREAIRYADELEHASTTSHVRFHAGAHLAALLGDSRAAEAHADAVIAVASEYHLQAWWGFGAVLRGWALARDGRAAGRARPRAPRRRDHDALGDMWHGPRFWCSWPKSTPGSAISPRLCGWSSGRRRRCSAPGKRLWEADVHRAEGELRRLAGAPGPEVEACFAAALAVARQQEAQSFELRAAASSPGSGATRVGGPRPAISWRPSTAGSPRASTRRTCGTRGCCSTSFGDGL